MLPTLLLVVLALLLLWAAISDVRARIIPNWLNIVIALLAPVWWWAVSANGAAILLHIGCAIGALLLFGLLFVRGMMGGGDVKLITALALWLPAPALLEMLVWMALGGGVLTIAMLLIHKLRRAPDRPEIPYGVAIAAAAVLVMANDILTVTAA